MIEMHKPSTNLANWLKKHKRRFMFLPAWILGILLAFIQIAPLSADESSASFQRLMHNIQRWTTQPRLMGSAYIEYVRAGLIAEIEDMGLTPELQDFVYTLGDVMAARALLGQHWVYGGIHYTRMHSAFFTDGPIHMQNILVRFESNVSDRVILFVSHYDSVLGSPGAGDAMLPIAAMLEAMRVLAGRDDLQANIYFLLTDGEEYGAFGALEFIRANEELGRRVDMVVNLEAIGNAGVPVLFETSPQPATMVRYFGASVPRPVGFSLGAIAYERTGIGWTDFTFFLQYGWQGVNMALTRGARYYHTAQDTYENLCRNAAYNYMRTVVAMAEHAADNGIDALQGRAANAVFFPFLPGNLVVISYGTAYVLGGAICALAVTYMIWQLKHAKQDDKQQDKKQSKKPRNLLMIVLTLLAVASLVFLHAASYLLWIPLLFLLVVDLLKGFRYAYIAAKAVSIIVMLMLWVPVVFLSSALFMGLTFAI